MLGIVLANCGLPIIQLGKTMPPPQELEAKFWKSLGSDRTMMLGLDGVDDGHTRPMTAQFENDRVRFFFTVKDNEPVSTQRQQSSDCNVCLRITRYSRLSTVSCHLIWIAQPLIDCGIASSPLGTKAGRMIRSSLCFGSTRSRRRSGSTTRICSPESSCYSALIRRRITRKRSQVSLD